MLTVYIFTNGRSTLEYCQESIKRANDKWPVVILENMSMLDAFDYIIQNCKTPYFTKIDDDFLLHPAALYYMTHCVSRYAKPEKIGIFYSRLWEDFSTRAVDCVKIYNLEAMRTIGGPRVDPATGRIDDATNRTLVASGYTNLKDLSLVGIHACSTLEEHDQYQSLWDKQATSPWVKPTRKFIEKYTQSLEYQYLLTTEFLDNLNQEDDTPFYRYILGNDIQQGWQGVDIKRKDSHLLLA